MLVLHGRKLGRLCLYLENMPLGCLHWRRRKDSKSMQDLRLASVRAAEFEVGECVGGLELDGVNICVLELKDNLQHLSIDNSEIGQVKLANLNSLTVLELLHLEDFENVWLRMYSKILRKAGLGLCRLTIQGELPDKGLINMDVVGVQNGDQERRQFTYKIIVLKRLGGEGHIQHDDNRFTHLCNF
ncbi:hypothetical protein L7F22_063501 [Adiantum nelumboides]|nr:hypothetical protein [Adiantum nelumboides]